MRWAYTYVSAQARATEWRLIFFTNWSAAVLTLYHVQAPDALANNAVESTEEIVLHS